MRFDVKQYSNIEASAFQKQFILKNNTSHVFIVHFKGFQIYRSIEIQNSERNIKTNYYKNTLFLFGK